jgi:glycine/sarcosine N-methyltransferase
MGEGTAAFYSDLAEHYHLIFEDWDRSIERQAGVLSRLLEARLGPVPLKVLDCACGIGTQTIGLAKLGYTVVASDVSDAAVRRAERETGSRGLEVRYHVADMRNLSPISDSLFDVVLAADNALPHLRSDDDLILALENISTKLKDGGLFVATIRDYDQLLETRPTFQGPAFYLENGRRRIVHQVWDWRGNDYMVHVYITLENEASWETKHFTTTYRALERKTLTEILARTGFRSIEWLMPESTGYYQPIVISRKSLATP